LLKFAIRDFASNTIFDESSTTAILTGILSRGTRIVGQDKVEIVGRKRGVDAAIPEPSAIVLLSLGSIGLCCFRNPSGSGVGST
jgi:hypothetical protein